MINASERDKDSVKDYIDEGGINQDFEPQPIDTTGFAEGGRVASPTLTPMQNLYPQQAQLMTAAKARISNHLTGIKPQVSPQGLPFDKRTMNPQQEKAYDKALNIAVAPLSILKHIKDGTLQASDMAHMNSMYPELTKHLQQKLVDRIVHAQDEGEHPSGHVKQAMALFLGAPLEGWMTPAGIVAAQATFAPKQTPQQGQQQGKTKKGTTNLGKSNKSYKTASQAAEADTTSRKEE